MERLTDERTVAPANGHAGHERVNAAKLPGDVGWKADPDSTAQFRIDEKFTIVVVLKHFSRGRYWLKDQR